MNIRINKVIEKNGKISLYIGDTPEPFEDSTELLRQVLTILKDELAIRIVDINNSPLLVEIEGVVFQVFCDDLMPLSFHSENSKATYIFDKIKDRLKN